MTTDRKGPVREKTGQTELKVASGARGRPTNLAPLPVPPFDIGFCHPPFWRTALAAVCPGSLSSLALAVGLVCALCPAEAEQCPPPGAEWIPPHPFCSPRAPAPPLSPK